GGTAALAVAVGGLAGEGVRVAEHGVDLPALAVRGLREPELVLLGVAAGAAAFVQRAHSSSTKPGLFAVDCLGVLDLYAEVVERAALAGVLDQHQLQRRFGDGEVGVTLPDL